MNYTELQTIRSLPKDEMLIELAHVSGNELSCQDKFPEHHRICDIIVKDRAFRITRCAACHENIYVSDIDVAIAHEEETGVPLELRGEALRQWIEYEKESPSKEEVDWKYWLAITK